MRAFLAAYIASLALRGASAACQARVNVGSQWVFPNGTQAGDVHLDISNTDGTNLSVPWDLTVQDSAYTGILQSWNLDGVALSGGTVTARATLPWEGLLPNGASTVDLGFVAAFTGSPTALLPTAVSVAGTPCTILTGASTPGSTLAGPTPSSTPSSATTGSPVPSSSSASPVGTTSAPTTNTQGPVTTISSQAAAPSQAFRNAPAPSAAPSVGALAGVGRKLLWVDVDDHGSI